MRGATICHNISLVIAPPFNKGVLLDMIKRQSIQTFKLEVIVGMRSIRQM